MEQNNNNTNNYQQPQTGTPPQQGYTQPQNSGYYQQPQGQPQAQNYQYQQHQQQQQNYYQQQPQVTPDAMENKGLGALCYLGTVFVILALVANGKSPFVRHHANQGVALDVLTLLSTLMMIIPFLGWIAYGIFSVVLFVFRIMGLLKARNGQVSTSPICGGWNFIR